MDVCEVCGDDLFMVVSGDLTCIKRCRFVAPTKDQYERLVVTKVKRIPHQLRTFAEAMQENRETWESND